MKVNNLIQEFDVVRLKVDLTSEGVTAGSIGTVMLVHTSPKTAYEVEFCDSKGRPKTTSETVTLYPDQIEKFELDLSLAYLVRACASLGLEANVDVEVRTPNGLFARADAVVSQMNVDFKVYIFNSESSPLKEVLDFISSNGDTWSTFGSPTDSEPFDLDSYAEMFNEWGFDLKGPSKKKLDFSRRPEDEKRWMTQNTWCGKCQKADLGLSAPSEYEVSGKIFLEGNCRKCGTRVFSEVSVVDQ